MCDNFCTYVHICKVTTCAYKYKYLTNQEKTPDMLDWQEQLLA